MKFGVSLPPFGELADPHAMLELARATEDAGWDGFFPWDHLMYEPGVDIADPWLLLAAAAVVTERMRLGPMITPLPRRRPWKVAKEAVTLDHLSGGRVILGVGLGVDYFGDYGAFGGEAGDDRRRAELLDDSLAIVTRLWSGETVHFDGRQASVDGASFLPKPVQQPRIPIWCAAMWPNRTPLRRAARYDGAVLVGVPSPKDVREIVGELQDHRTDDGPFDVAVLGADADPAAYEQAGATWALAVPGEGRALAAVHAGIDKGPPR